MSMAVSRLMGSVRASSTFLQMKQMMVSATVSMPCPGPLAMDALAIVYPASTPCTAQHSTVAPVRSCRLPPRCPHSACNNAKLPRPDPLFRRRAAANFSDHEHSLPESRVTASPRAECSGHRAAEITRRLAPVPGE